MHHAASRTTYHNRRQQPGRALLPIQEPVQLRELPDTPGVHAEREDAVGIRYDYQAGKGEAG